MSRLAQTFEQSRGENRAAFVAFVTAGDPDFETSLALVKGLPQAGVDVIELGMPFSDPMADGAAIQASSLRALRSGMTLARTLDLLRGLRAQNAETPVVLMGYFNPIHAYGIEAFCADAAEAGADGLIIVDLPPEEDGELRHSAAKNGLDVVRLATPTTEDTRLPTILDGAGGFLYYVSITGITGTASARQEEVESAVSWLKSKTALPVAVGFGIKTPEDAARTARFADGVVVGSALVDLVAPRDEGDREGGTRALDYARKLARAVHGARQDGGSENAPKTGQA